MVQSMPEPQLILAPRGYGKTQILLGEIRKALHEDLHGLVVLYVPDHRTAQWWTLLLNEESLPVARLPRQHGVYISVLSNDNDPAHGMRPGHVFAEDVHLLEEGIYTEAIRRHAVPATATSRLGD